MTGLGADRAAANAVGGGASGFTAQRVLGALPRPRGQRADRARNADDHHHQGGVPGRGHRHHSPAASITAAANCVGAIARSASAVGSAVGVWHSDQLPNRADAAAAHMHSTPARNIRSPYEAADESAHRAPCGPVFLLGLIAT